LGKSTQSYTFAPILVFYSPNKFLNMKFLPIALGAFLLLNACKNDNSTNSAAAAPAAGTETPAVQAPPPPSPEAVAETISNAKTTLSSIEQLYDKIGAAIDKASGEKKQALFALRTELQGAMGKQQSMIQMAEGAQTAMSGQNGNDTEVAGQSAASTIADIKESASRYTDFLKSIEQRFNDIMAK
jgi:hypothetical protein